jgi:hypothetical protein
MGRRIELSSRLVCIRSAHGRRTDVGPTSKHNSWPDHKLNWSMRRRIELSSRLVCIGRHMVGALTSGQRQNTIVGPTTS